jgi:glycosyltransferase involved in cell wall biosynthesis
MRYFLMHRLRALFVTQGTDFAGGGAELSLLELIDALRADGRVEPIVTVPGSGDMASAIERRGTRWISRAAPRWVPFDPTTVTRRLWRVRMALASVKQIPAWVALLRRERPDVVVTNTATTPVAAVASRFVGIPHIWWVHEFVTSDHGLSYALGERWSQRLIGWLSRFVVVNSRALSDYYSARIPGRKLRVVYYAIDAPPVGTNRIQPGALRLLLLGRQTPSKGSELAVRALADVKDSLPGVRLRLVGSMSPGYRQHIESVARALGVQANLEIVPYTTAPAEQIDWSNLLLMCSSNEAFGRVTAEALKGGRPVIGARSGGTTELVTEGVDGYLFAPGSVDELASAIGRLGSNPDLLESMSSAASTRSAQRFSREDELESFVDLLQQAAGGRTP